MSENVKDAVPQILMKIQDDLASFRWEMVDRLDRIETVQKQERRNSAAMLVMMRGTVGVFDERLGRLEADRIVRLEDRMTALEGRGADERQRADGDVRDIEDHSGEAC